MHHEMNVVKEVVECIEEESILAPCNSKDVKSTTTQGDVKRYLFQKKKAFDDDQSKKKVALTNVMVTSEKLKESCTNFVFIIYSLMKMACFGYVD